MLITLYKIGELHFPCLGTNGFHVKAKSDRFTSASFRCPHAERAFLRRERQPEENISQARTEIQEKASNRQPSWREGMRSLPYDYAWCHDKKERRALFAAMSRFDRRRLKVGNIYSKSDVAMIRFAKGMLL